MTLYDRARDAFNTWTNGTEHEKASAAIELARNSADFAAELVRLHDQLTALVDAVDQEAEAKSATGNFLMGEYHGSFAARIREVIERGE